MAKPTRRPQKPKIRNFVAKHARDIARGAGPHKNERLDYTRHPRHKPDKASRFSDEFDYDEGEELDLYEEPSPRRFRP